MTNTCSLPFPAQASELNYGVLPEDKLHFIPQMKPVSLSGGASQNSVVWGTWQVPNENKCITLCLMRFCVVSLFGERWRSTFLFREMQTKRSKTYGIKLSLSLPASYQSWLQSFSESTSFYASPLIHLREGQEQPRTELLLKGISSNMVTNKSGATQYVETQNGRRVHVKTKLQNTFWTCHIHCKVQRWENSRSLKDT